MIDPDINFPFEEGKIYVFYLENNNKVTGVYDKTTRNRIEGNELVEIAFHRAAENGITFLTKRREFELWNYNEESIPVDYVHVQSIFGQHSKLLGFKEINLSDKDFFELGITQEQKEARDKILRDQHVDDQREDTTIGIAEVVVDDDEDDDDITVMINYDGQMFPRNNREDYFKDNVIGIYHATEALEDALLYEDIEDQPMIITISPTGQITYYKKSSFMSEITRQAGLGRTKLTMKDPFTNIPLNQFYIMPWMNEPVGKRSAKAKPPAGKRAKASAEAEAHPGAALGGTLKKRRRRRNTRRRRRSLMR